MFGLPTAIMLASMAVALAPASGSFLRRLDAMEYQSLMVAPRGCSIEPGVDYIGNDIADKPSSAPGGCCDICKQFPNCRAYSWNNRDGGTCYLKSAKGSVVPKAGVTSAAINDYTPPRCSAVEYDVDYVGNDFASVPEIYSGECCFWCIAYEACNAWSWSDANGGTCWLKTATGEKVPKAGVRSASSFLVTGTSCPTPINDLDIVGNDIGNKPSSTAEGCCDICKLVNNCRAYSWTNQNGGTCWLKSAMGATLVNGGVKSAMIYDDKRSCSAVENDVDYIGNDVANAPAGDASACCPLCAKNDACNAWTWSNLNGGTC